MLRANGNEKKIQRNVSIFVGQVLIAPILKFTLVDSVHKSRCLRGFFFVMNVGIICCSGVLMAFVV
jgi:membrane protein CcdC involved in cytochrome C biogenesis